MVSSRIEAERKISKVNIHAAAPPNNSLSPTPRAAFNLYQRKHKCYPAAGFNELLGAAYDYSGLAFGISLILFSRTPDVCQRGPVTSAKLDKVFSSLPQRHLVRATFVIRLIKLNCIILS